MSDFVNLARNTSMRLSPEMRELNILKFKIESKFDHLEKQGSLNLQQLNDKPKDYYLSIDEIIKNAGFIPEFHEVTTEDGYVLTMVRVKDKNFEKGAPVVFM